MKKLLAVIAAAVTACTLSMSVFAADISTGEQSILDAISTADINGVALVDEYSAMATNYFMTEGVDVTDAQAADFIEDMNATIEFCETNGITALATLAVTGTNIDATALAAINFSEKTALLDSAEAMCADIGLTFTYKPVSKKAIVTDSEGAVVSEITGAVKQTGGYVYVAIVSAVLLGLVAVSVLTAKSKKLVG